MAYRITPRKLRVVAANNDGYMKNILNLVSLFHSLGDETMKQMLDSLTNQGVALFHIRNKDETR